MKFLHLLGLRHFTEEDAGVADAADIFAAEFGWYVHAVLLDGGLIGFEACFDEADLHQAVFCQSGVDLLQHGFGQALFADVDVGLQALCDAAELFLFSAGKWDSIHN